MSPWIERIIKEFPADLSHLWIAVDPDDILLNEQVFGILRERGFDILLFEDSVTFRAEYEERYRMAWDNGNPGSAVALILHLRGVDFNNLPWDYLKQARKVNLSLADLFTGCMGNRPFCMMPSGSAGVGKGYNVKRSSCCTANRDVMRLSAGPARQTSPPKRTPT